jgi:repressor of nif and glnA expression
VKPLTNEQVINPILNCNSKIDILRVLTKAEDPLTGRRIAMLGGISGRSCQLSLQALTEAGVLVRKVVGRAHTYTLDHSHHLVKEVVIPLFETEDALLA